MTEDSTNKETFEQRLNRETRPPNGQRLNLHSLRFAEVIKMSEAENAQKGFDRLFEEQLPVKNAVNFTSDKDTYRKFIAQSRKAFLSMRYAYIQGFASKAYADLHKEGIITRPVRELPTGIDSLNFFLCQMIH